MSKIENSEQIAYKSHLKEIYLELPNYKFNHASLGENDKDTFIGREELVEKFANTLINSAKTGAYLVTGYRGMGKTSFVKKTLAKYREAYEETKLFRILANKLNSEDKSLKVGGFKSKLKSKNVHPINMTFAQSNIDDYDILKQLAKQILLVIERRFLISFIHKRLTLINCIIFLFPLFLIGLISNKYGWYFISKNFNNYEGIYKHFNELKVILTLALFSAIGFYFFVVKLLIIKGTLLFFKFEDKVNRIGLIKNFISSKNFGFFVAVNTIVFFVTFVLILVTKKYKMIFDLKSLNVILYLIIVLLFIISSCFLFFYMYRFFRLKEKIDLEYSKLVSIYGRLVVLNERCDSSISSENGVQSNSENLPFGFVKKKTRNFPLASSKEIENELSEILKLIDGLEHFFNRYQFVFVFDELDKVEPNNWKGNYNEDLTDFEKNSMLRSKSNDLRERKVVIMEILASLKYFINESPAKFIFIAGREMFEASLADISDRQSAIGSIFHQVIYVDSFLKDIVSLNSEKNLLSSMVEHYVLRLLMPDVEVKKCTFPNYYKTLSHELPDEIKKKMIFTLQNFIIYLTYRSNGSPKKLVKLIEDHIVIRTFKNCDNKSVVSSPSIGSNQHFYLQFTPETQYKLGYITYLYRPFIHTYGQFLKKYSDSLLVSTPFLMDHLIKFNKYAFSLHNLELIPEIISQNKHTEMRFFIQDLINYLSNSHLRETEIGLFEYKFYNKTYLELSYLSKTNEEEAAAFSFTLDENYGVKMYLRVKIKELRSIYKDFKQGEENIHSISFLNLQLGDAQYFDEEYEDAITSYSDAIHTLRYTKSGISIKQLIFLLNTRLKIGLTYEKMKYFDMALGYYLDAIEEFQKFISKDSTEMSYNSGIFMNSVGQIINQAYLSALYVTEKLNSEGVSLDKVKKSIYSFKIILSQYNSTKKAHIISNKSQIIFSNFYSNAGTLLYYKNYIERNNEISEDKGRHVRLTNVAQDYYVNSLKCLIIAQNNDFKSKDLKDILSELNSKMLDYHNIHDKVYLKNVAINLNKLADSILANITEISFEIETVFDTSSLHKISYIKQLNTTDIEILDSYWLESFVSNDSFCAKKDFAIVLYIYYLSSRYFYKAGRNQSFSFQVRKILKLIGQLGVSSQPNKKFIHFCNELLFKSAMFVVSTNGYSSDRNQIAKYKTIFDIEGTFSGPSLSKQVYNHISTSPESMELILLMGKINLKFKDWRGFKLTYSSINDIPEYDILNQNSAISSQLTRLHQLIFQVDLNFKLIQNCNLDFISNFLIKINSPDQLRQIYDTSKLASVDKTKYSMNNTWNEEIESIFAVILNSIASLKESQNIINVYGINYTTNYSILARIHEKLGDWIAMFDYCSKIFKEVKDISSKTGSCIIKENESRLEDLIGLNNFKSLDPFNEYQIALQNYHKTIQLHSEGYVFKEHFTDMHYLEDDFNDNMYHFFIALDRVYMNNGYISKKINRLSSLLECSIIYNYDQYVNIE